MDKIAQLPGYSLTERIYEGSRTLVYRGLRDRDQCPVVVKFPKNPFPSFNELVQFSNQYSIAKPIKAANITRPLALLPYGKASALIMEDFGGCDLKQFLAGVKREGLTFSNVSGRGTSRETSALGNDLEGLILFCQIAIQVAEALIVLDEHRIIHKDIKPANILIHPGSHQVKLIDFSIATTLPRETLEHFTALEGTLAYLSPEQTGRMNRGLDYRSDFYSLGVTCYELLTGKLPFAAEDPMDIVHSHLARQPVPPHERCSDRFPLALSDIVLKLMAKNAEDRYQSAFGLKHDLEYCLHQLKETGEVQPFPLAQQDMSDRFILPEKLYGRTTEVAHLLAAFERVCQGNTELMLISGSSGIGKTAVINEVHKPIVHQRGYFVRGKFNQLQRNVPLSGFIEAFRSLIRLLLSESDAQLEQWRVLIMQALGRSAQCLIAVIPELTGIVGPQPPAPELPPTAAEERFHRLMKAFVSVFSGPRHPLVIFLDDLQWADAASLKLLKVLMQDDGHLLMIGAYRDREVSPAHPLMLTVEEILLGRQEALASENASEHDAEEGLKLNHSHVNRLRLSPLGPQDVLHLVADTLGCALPIAKPLADLIYQKAQGNPFFSAQCLSALHADGKITFEREQRQWCYHLPEIAAAIAPDDVVAFMGQRLQKLPQATQTALYLAACIGNRFDLSTLAIAADCSHPAMAADLWPALRTELIVPIGEDYKAYSDQADDAKACVSSAAVALNPTYRFFHDRIQQAAYSLLPSAQRASTHLSIGMRLLARCGLDSQAGELFPIVNHLNQAREIIEHTGEQSLSPRALSPRDLAGLNLQAGQQARAATAYVTAFDYLETGLSLLSEGSWETAYELTLGLHSEAAEIAYLVGDLVAMQRAIDEILAQARTLLDQARAYEVQIQAAIGEHHFLQALEVALRVLSKMGLEIAAPSPKPKDTPAGKPEDASEDTAAQGLIALGDRSSRLSIDAIADLPEMENATAQVVIRLLTKAISAAYIARPEMLPQLVNAGIERCLTFGNSPLSAFLYSWYATLLCDEGKVERGYQIAQLALRLLEKLPEREIRTRVHCLVYAFVFPWKDKLAAMIAPLKEAYQMGLEQGDGEYAAWAIAAAGHYGYLSGQPLDKLAQDCARYCHSLEALRQDAAQNYLRVIYQVVLNLLDQGGDPGSGDPMKLEGEAYSEALVLPVQLATQDLTGLAYLHINKGILAYLFAQPAAAQACFDQAIPYLSGIGSSQWLPALAFYDSLAALALPAQTSLSRVALNQQKLKAWARRASVNHLHRWHLVEAERARWRGDKAGALDHYDQAIALALANGYQHEAALAHELAAQFYLLWGKGHAAKDHMIEAYYAYSRWGARAKIGDLERRYPQLLGSILKQRQQPPHLSSTDTILAYANTTTTTTSTGISEAIDLNTLLQTSQVLSREIQLDKLLAALLEAVIQNAGADKCALLLPQAEQWVIEAYASLGSPPTLLQSEPLKAGEKLPLTLINQVRHTCEAAVIFNATVHPALTVDPYVLRCQPKSILCAPLLNQGKLIAILYLENNLTLGAFTNHRVEVINLLCTQAAISLENARLYRQAQQALADLQASHMQLVQSEKMSALGNLVAGIAHEINNPINFLKGNLKPALNYVNDLFDLVELIEQDEPREAILEEMEAINLEFIREDLPNLLNSMTFGIGRIRDISTSLRTFSRADKEYKTEFDLHEGLDSTLLILKHRLQGSDRAFPIEVVKQYGHLPLVYCFAGQLNQVFMNLIANAIDALEEMSDQSSGCITLTTALLEEETVSITIADNGPGMDAATQARVFEHLFTTKPVGKGTGLGLAISHDIVVKKHGGTLTVNSEVGKGTAFVITLPVGGEAQC